jgi:hypothetical protein
MKITRQICCWIVLGAALAAHGQGAVTPASTGVVVVVNSANPTNDLSLTDLRSMLMGERHFWRGNVQVRLVLRDPGTPERDAVIFRLLRMTQSEFTRMWKTKEFRGELAGLPEFRFSDAQVLQYVREHPGAIGILATRNLPNDVKLLKIDGKLPGDPAYPLK